MKRLLLILLLLMIMVLPAGVVAAAPLDDEIVHEGETINNDVIVFDGDLEIRSGATVNGDVIVFNGDALVAGTVNGDLVLFNGNLEAGASANVTGDCVLLKGELSNQSESGLHCTDVENFPLGDIMPAIAAIPSLPGVKVPDAPAPPGRGFGAVSGAGHFFGNLFESVAGSLLLGLLAFLVASAAPHNLRQVEEVIRRKPLASGGVGLLTAVAVPSLVALLLPVSIILSFICIGLLGFPIMAALMVGLVAAGVFGWIGVGTILGQRLARPLGIKSDRLPVMAALGTVALTLGLGVLSLIPFVFAEGLLVFIVVCVGLGATALTQFGMKPYPRLAEVTEPDDEKLIAVLDTLPEE